MDLNNDGILDVIVGSYADGVNYYQGTGTATIAAGVKLKDSTGADISGTGGRFMYPNVVDINNDGLLDLIMGSGDDGSGAEGWEAPAPIKLYLNTGTLEQHQFEYQGFIEDINGEEIRYVYNRAVVADMNNDGLKDIVCATETNRNVIPFFGSDIFLHTNIGTLEKPAFDEAEILAHVDGSPIVSEWSMRVGVTDFDNDGVKDLLFNGSEHGLGEIVLLTGVLP